MASWAWRIRSQAKDILYHLQKLIRGIFAFPLSITFISITVTSRAAALILKTQMSGFTKKKKQPKKKPMRFLPLSQLCRDDWRMLSLSGGGIVIHSTFNLLSAFKILQPTSFQQRIKQLLTEEWRDWQVKGSFLVRRGPLCLSGPHVFPELTFTFQRDLSNFFSEFLLLWKYDREIFWSPPPPDFSHSLPKTTPVHQRGE